MPEHVKVVAAREGSFPAKCLGIRIFDATGDFVKDHPEFPIEIDQHGEIGIYPYHSKKCVFDSQTGEYTICED